MRTEYQSISIAGGDTAQPLAMEKRLRFIRACDLPPGTRFLDCGSGAGEYVFALIEKFQFDAHGLEYEADKVRRGQTHPKWGDRISQGDLQAVPLESEQWDAAMLNEVLEHVPDEAQALREVHRLLRRGGFLFVFSPNRWFPFETHGVKTHSGKRVPHWVPFIPYIPVKIGSKFLNYWARNYNQTELRELLEAAGFKIIETGFIWQSFEGISGRQPKLITWLKPVLRAIANTLEATPFLRRFGVSQVFVCRK